MEILPIHKSLEPIKWLIGKWVSKCGSGKYPTICPFKYCEEIEFITIGQPMLHYKAQSWHPEKKVPLHSESGFLKVKPGTSDLVLVAAHNFGVTTIEEGQVEGCEISLTSKSISRMSFAKIPAVTKVERKFSLTEGSLCQVLFMETSNTALTEHLRISYHKVEP